MSVKINETILTILSRATIEGNTIKLTCGQLDRKQYMEVNKILEIMGGKWNRKEKGHVFSEDPTDKLDNILLTGEIETPKKFGYFPTPPDLAEKVVKQAEILPGMLILEPSAGSGSLAEASAKLIGKEQIRCVELLEDNCETLRKKGFTVQHGDFLSIYPIPYFDRIIMNPPFERQQDIDHVLHALKFLIPGGRLVSIMSSGVLFRDNKKTKEFHNNLNGDGVFERLPEESFKESGTNVNCCLLTINKQKSRLSR